MIFYISPRLLNLSQNMCVYITILGEVVCEEHSELSKKWSHLMKSIDTMNSKVRPSYNFAEGHKKTRDSLIKGKILLYIYIFKHNVLLS